jgi:hypothetical protein
VIKKGVGNQEPYACRINAFFLVSWPIIKDSLHNQLSCKSIDPVYRLYRPAPIVNKISCVGA